MAINLTQSNLLGQLKFELERYNLGLQINPSFAKGQKDILNLAEYYYMSRYRDGDSDSLGQKKVFYNISVLPVEVASKQLDLDTKNIRLQGENWDSYWLSWLKGKELGLWMKEKYFGRQLNLYPIHLAKYGHLFVKKVKDEVMVVNPRQIIVRPDAEDLKQTPIIEYHKIPRDTYYALAKSSGWENYKLSESEEKGGEDVEFYEMFFPEGFWDSEYNYFIVRPGAEKVLVYANLSVNPYKALAWEKVPGRFLGRGQIEKLFEDQIYLNRIANYKAEGLAFTSRHLWQTRDENYNANLLMQTDNGDVLFAKSELTPVAMEERNLGFYNYEENRWEGTAMRKAFALEPLTGERAPSGVPLGTTMLSTQLAAGFYDQKKQDLASFVEEIIWDWVLPEFEKENNKDHEIFIQNLISGTDDYSNKFFNFLLAQRMNERRVSFMKAGKWLTEDQFKIMRGVQADLLKKEGFKIRKGDYGNLKEKIMIDIVGEHIDTPARLATLQTLIQMLGSNPTILQDPRIKKILFKTLDLAGFNPHEFDFDDEATGVLPEVQNLAAQRGGSIATPMMNQLPTAMKQVVNA